MMSTDFEKLYKDLSTSVTSKQRQPRRQKRKRLSSLPSALPSLPEDDGEEVAGGAYADADLSFGRLHGDFQYEEKTRSSSFSSEDEQELPTTRISRRSTMPSPLKPTRTVSLVSETSSEGRGKRRMLNRVMQFFCQSIFKLTLFFLSSGGSGEKEKRGQGN